MMEEFYSTRFQGITVSSKCILFEFASAAYIISGAILGIAWRYFIYGVQISIAYEKCWVVLGLTVLSNNNWKHGVLYVIGQSRI